MDKYFINGNTGAGNETIECEDLADAKDYADNNYGYCYTQCDVTIEQNSEVLSTRPWYGCSPDKNDMPEHGIFFGSFGYYGDWIDTEE